MKKFIYLIIVSCFFINSVNAVEFKPLELPKNVQKQTPQKEEVKKSETSETPETPKGLLSDEDYKFKGRVEYDESGVLFLKEEDLDDMKLNIKQPKKFAKSSVFTDENLFLKLEEQKRGETPKVDEYLALPFFGSSEYKAGKNVTYGTTFGTDLDNAQVEYRTKLFAKYDHRFFSFMTAVGKDAYTSSGRQMNSFFLVPELKLGKSVSLVESFKANPDYDRFRNEVVLRYKPNIKNSRENVQLEAGLSQTSYYKTGRTYYQFSVSTKFRF